MSLATANWTTTDPFTLVTGMRRLAAVLGVALSDQPTDQEKEALFKAMGENTDFADNIAEVDARLQDAGVSTSELLYLLQVTETLDVIDHRSVYGPLETDQPATVILTGAKVNWMVRRVTELKRRQLLDQVDEIIVLGGDRVCDTVTERPHPIVQAFGTAQGRYPTEHEVLVHLTSDLPVTAYSFGGSLENQIEQLMALLPSVVEGHVYVPTNSNATSVPLTVRRVIRSLYPAFDSDPARPQFSFSQDSLPLARNADELSNSRQYQNPKTVPSGLVRLLKELFALHASS